MEFVFTYGLALVAMGLLDAAKKSEEWEKDEAICRERIQQAAAGVARVIVPLCLTLPKKLVQSRLDVSGTTISTLGRAVAETRAAVTRSD